MFGENILRSTGDAVVNAAKGLPGTVKLKTLPFRMVSDPEGASKEALDDAKAVPQLLRGLTHYVGERYSSPSQAWDTLYRDPAGVAMDASTVLGGAGMGADVARMPGVATALSTASDLTNPLRAITAPTGWGLKKIAKVPVITTLRPNRTLRDEFGGASQIAQTVLDERLANEPSATSATRGATVDRDAAIGRLDAQGLKIPAQHIADGLNDARAAAQDDVWLGHPDQTPNIDTRAQQILQQGDVPVGKAQPLKTRAQSLAYDSRKRNQRAKSLTVDEIADEGVASAYRTGIEDAGRAGGEPEIGSKNERIQRLIGAERTWKDATDRSHALSNLVSAAASVATPVSTKAKLVLGAGLKALDMPQVGVPVGIGMNEIGRLLSNPTTARALLLSRLSGDD